MYRSKRVFCRRLETWFYPLISRSNFRRLSISLYSVSEHYESFVSDETPRLGFYFVRSYYFRDLSHHLTRPLWKVDPMNHLDPRRTPTFRSDPNWTSSHRLPERTLRLFGCPKLKKKKKKKPDFIVLTSELLTVCVSTKELL